jgi:hypothetical protein
LIEPGGSVDGNDGTAAASEKTRVVCLAGRREDFKFLGLTITRWSPGIPRLLLPAAMALRPGDALDPSQEPHLTDRGRVVEHLVKPISRA